MFPAGSFHSGQWQQKVNPHSAAGYLIQSGLFHFLPAVPKNPLHESHTDMSDCCVRFFAWNQPAITAYLFYRHDFQFYFRQGLPQSQIPGSPYAVHQKSSALQTSRLPDECQNTSQSHPVCQSPSDS